MAKFHKALVLDLFESVIARPQRKRNRLNTTKLTEDDDSGHIKPSLSLTAPGVFPPCSESPIVDSCSHIEHRTTIPPCSIHGSSTDFYPDRWGTVPLLRVYQSALPSLLHLSSTSFHIAEAAHTLRSPRTCFGMFPSASMRNAVKAKRFNMTLNRNTHGRFQVKAGQVVTDHQELRNASFALKTEPTPSISEKREFYNLRQLTSRFAHVLTSITQSLPTGKGIDAASVMALASPCDSTMSDIPSFCERYPSMPTSSQDSNVPLASFR